MAPGVSLAMISLPWFLVVNDLFALCLLTIMFFTLHTALEYTVFATSCYTVGYEPYLHYDKPYCIPDNLSVFSVPVVTHSAMPSPPHPYLPPERETLSSEVGIKDSEGSTDVICSPDS